MTQLQCAYDEGHSTTILVLTQSFHVSSVSAEAENLNEKYGTEGVKVQSGEGGLTKVVLSGRDGRCFSPSTVVLCSCSLVVLLVC